MIDKPERKIDTGGWQAPPESAPPGRTVGKYELKELIGAGAMGTVYRARDPDLQRDVAIKLMSPVVASDDKQRGRFHREARAAGSLQHPNIITVYGFGEADGELYIAMELVEGRDLSTVIRNREELPLAEKLGIISRVLSALEYAHARGITHRDIKPGNIRLTDDDHTKIMDFGVAHLAESDLTNSGLVLGTPNYIAPEQLKGNDPTPSGDIFSVGAVLYELLTYEKPFGGDTAHAILYNVASDEPVSLSGMSGTVPAGVRDVVRKAMEKSPERRYATAADMARGIASAKAFTADRTDAMATEATVVVTDQRPAPVYRSPRTNPRHLVVLGAATAATIWVVGARGTSASMPEPDTQTIQLSTHGASYDQDPKPEQDTAGPDTLLMSVRTAALAQRVRAEGAGVPSELLANGDADVAAADSMLEDGRYAQAIIALSSASAHWTQAEEEYRRRQEAARAARRRRDSAPRSQPPKAQRSPQTVGDTEPSQALVKQPADDDLEIGAVVDRLVGALESRSIDSLRVAYPRLSPRESDQWQRFFQSANELSVELSVSELESHGDSAKALVSGAYSYVTSTGSQRRPMAFPATFKRHRGAWRIEFLGKTEGS